MYCNVCNKNRKSEFQKMFLKEESIEILKMFILINNIKEYHKIYNHV